MKILVTGREGQVARSLAERGSGHELVFAARPDLNLLDPKSLEKTIAEIHPELIISAAAYTAVDQAEDEPELAMAANGEAPGIIGRAAAKIGAPVLHLSTDYVFNGIGENPWTETDPTAPIGVYGMSKLVGEQALATSGANYAILRTAWVYSPFGSNFVTTMLRLAESREELSVVADQYGNPTSAYDVVDALFTIVKCWLDQPRHGADKVYHLAGNGTANWADFARAIFAESYKRGGPVSTVRGISTLDYPTKARRPANSRLDCTRFSRTFGYSAPQWEYSLAKVIDRLI